MTTKLETIQRSNNVIKWYELKKTKMKIEREEKSKHVKSISDQLLEMTCQLKLNFYKNQDANAVSILASQTLKL